jgi:hypothetical protein
MTGTHPLGNWSTNPDGYPKFHSGKHRKKFVHRVVFEQIAGRPIREGFQVHHQGAKTDFRPHMLVELPKELNPPREPLRNPWTGKFMSRDEYERLMGR